MKRLGGTRLHRACASCCRRRRCRWGTRGSASPAPPAVLCCAEPSPLRPPNCSAHPAGQRHRPSLRPAGDSAQWRLGHGCAAAVARWLWEAAVASWPGGAWRELPLALPAAGSPPILQQPPPTFRIGPGQALCARGQGGALALAPCLSTHPHLSAHLASPQPTSRCLKLRPAVCDDEFGNLEASLVCQQLGFGDNGVVHPAAYYGEGTGPTW